MNINISGRDYRIEYTFEAVLCEECVQQVIALFDGLAGGEEEATKGISEMPHVVITMFYAGLLENHGCTKEEAKNLLKTYFREQKGNPDATFYGMCQKLFEQMEEDGFFRQIGLSQIQENQPQPVPMTPQDHKKKTSASKK